MAIYRDVYEALTRAGVRFVVVGGQAVVLHGHGRMTVDLDLVLDLDPAAAAAGIAALQSCGLMPRPPVDAADFADPVVREAWITEKDMMVFSMFDPSSPRREVDLFVREPVPFAELVARAVTVEVDGVAVEVASIQDLIEMKLVAGRPQDLADVEALRGLP